MTYDALLQQIDRRLAALGLSERKACLKANLKVDAIRNIRRGRAPRAETLQALAKVLDCPLGELLETAGGGMAEAEPPPFEGFPVPAGYVPVPTLQTRAGMGGGGYAEEDLMGPATLFPEALVRFELRARPEDLLVMDVEGPSMEPLLQSGDRILVNRRKTNPSQPGVFVLWDGFGLVAKLIERVPLSDPARLKVMSQNDRFSTYEVLAEEARIVGRVVWLARKL